jgi:hypothetical protein
MVATMARRTVGTGSGPDTLAALHADVARDTRRRPGRSVKRLRSLLTACALGVSLVAQNARAEVCPASEDAPAVTQPELDERLDYLARAFDREIRDVDAWSWTWGSVYTAGTIALGVALSSTHDHETRIDLTVGVISTAFGAVSLYGLPLKLTLPLRSSRAHWDAAGRCATLARAERTLVSVEKDQALATGIFAHLGNVAVNAAIVLILGVGYGQWSSAALSGGIGVAVGEANVLTQPHHLRDVLAHYRSGQFNAPEAKVAWSVVPVLAHQMSGATLTVSW